MISPILLIKLTPELARTIWLLMLTMTSVAQATRMILSIADFWCPAGSSRIFISAQDASEPQGCSYDNNPYRAANSTC